VVSLPFKSGDANASLKAPTAVGCQTTSTALPQGRINLAVTATSAVLEACGTDTFGKMVFSSDLCHLQSLSDVSGDSRVDLGWPMRAQEHPQGGCEPLL